MQYLKWIALGVACGTLAVVVSRPEVQQDTFYRELQDRRTQLGVEVVDWAHNQVARRVGSGWEQLWSSDVVWSDDEDRQLWRTLEALCAWAKTVASDDACGRILQQETPFPAIQKARELLGKLDTCIWFPAGRSRIEQREAFTELDAEIQELIRI